MQQTAWCRILPSGQCSFLVSSRIRQWVGKEGWINSLKHTAATKSISETGHKGTLMEAMTMNCGVYSHDCAELFVGRDLNSWVLSCTVSILKMLVGSVQVWPNCVLIVPYFSSAAEIDLETVTTVASNKIEKSSHKK